MLALLLPGSAPAAPPVAAPGMNVLFMGADLTVEKDKEFHLVQDVTPTDLIIKPGGKPVRLPLTQAADLRINETLKLAEASAGIDHLDAERAYSANADPFLDLARSTALAAGESALADLANGAKLRASMSAAGAAMSGDPVGAADATAQAAEAEAQATQLYNTPQAEAYHVGSQSVKAVGGEPMYDAIRLTFEVTAQSNLTQPYYAVIAQIRDRDSKPGQVRKWAFVRTLGPMNAGEIRNVTVYRGGFPPGYILEGCQVHVYNRGEELSTNLSRKRVPLTDDEALEYRIIEYIGAHKGRTLPAVPAIAKLPSGWRERLAADQINGTYYVRVARSGEAGETFRDAAGERPLRDPSVDAVLKALRFKPALKEGKPVESIVPVNLGQLVTR